MLEQGPVVFVQFYQVSGSVPGLARKQDKIMRTRDRVDAVELHKSETLDDVEQGRAGNPTLRWIG